MTRRRPAFVGVVVAAAMALAGCGGDDDPTVEPDPSPSVTRARPDVAIGGGVGAPGTDKIVLRAALTGPAEVPGPGDADGTGSALLSFDPAAGEVCFDLTVNGIEPATAAHIHDGGERVAGPVVVGLVAPASGSAQGCSPAERALIDRIVAGPAGFYVNVHNAPFPAGAVRGQLGR